jgi:Pin2-interacting protein X1
MGDISMLLGKKTLAKLGSQMNDNAGSKPSNFAMRQMEKMGWTEGKGLGKNESGIAEHIKITKREDAAGLGTEALKTEAMEASESWWHDAFTVNLKKITAKHEKKSKSSKKRKAEEVEVSDKPPSYDELFKATGGARLGMRARADQKGKIKRTEGLEREDSGILGGLSIPVVASVGTTAGTVVVTAEVSTSGSTDDEACDTEKGSAKKARKEKKDKKEKKSKKDKRDKGDSDKDCVEECEAEVKKSKKDKKKTR